MKLFGRSTDEVDEIDAGAEIKWLEEKGFWSMVAKNIENAQNSIYIDLKKQSNTRDEDMFNKGQLRGIQRAMIEIDRVKTNLQRKP